MPEGSLLLWVLIQAGWTVTVATFSRGILRVCGSRFSYHGFDYVGCLLLLSWRLTPFLRYITFLPCWWPWPEPITARSGLIIHPPMLLHGLCRFLCCILFRDCFYHNEWSSLIRHAIIWSRPWTIAAWLFLTYGRYHFSGFMVGILQPGFKGWLVVHGIQWKHFIHALVGWYCALMHSLAVTEKRSIKSLDSIAGYLAILIKLVWALS